MLMVALAAAVQAAPPPASPNPAPAFPPEIRNILEKAIASGDPASVAAVAKFAKQAYPAAAPGVDSMLAAFRQAQEGRAAEALRVHREKLARDSILDDWKGSVEIGGARSTGSARSLGVYAAIAAHRDGLRWRHRFEARAEIQRTNDILSKERITASWQPRYLTGDHFYLFGLGLYERDPFLGFDDRFTAAGGAGYSLVDNPHLHLDLEGGPAVRQIQFHAGGDATRIAARASASLDWKISPRLQLKQSGSLYLETGDGTGNAVTELDASLFGPFKVRLSYELHYERDQFRNLDTLDTSSRATFVYAF